MDREEGVQTGREDQMNSGATMLPIEQLDCNTYNPNRMTDAEFEEFVAEVRRLGRLPKPIIVRQKAGAYEIVDGEHGWRAAREVGLAEVPVEVIEADDCEAMLQALKRNQHGTVNRVLEGRMFQRMRGDRDLSLRDLEKLVGKSQGYVRNSLAYAKLARLRSQSAPKDEADAEVAAMRPSEVIEMTKDHPPIYWWNKVSDALVRTQTAIRLLLVQEGNPDDIAQFATKIDAMVVEWEAFRLEHLKPLGIGEGHDAALQGRRRQELRR